ncbi:hypothetical protein B0H19DRAFT_1260073 [Mycena capillaripes]|nr:hypothetical protein B0H19DRAFT_1260073 [Mycena capillaripes]
MKQKQDAVAATKVSVNSFGAMFLQNVEKEAIEPGKTLTFYLFNEDNQWIPFPPITMTDDEAWKVVVPEPLGMLGVIAT